MYGSLRVFTAIEHEPKPYFDFPHAGVANCSFTSALHMHHMLEHRRRGEICKRPWCIESAIRTWS